MTSASQTTVNGIIPEYDASGVSTAKASDYIRDQHWGRRRTSAASAVGLSIASKCSLHQPTLFTQQYYILLPGGLRGHG